MEMRKSLSLFVLFGLDLVSASAVAAKDALQGRITPAPVLPAKRATASVISNAGADGLKVPDGTVPDASLLDPAFVGWYLDGSFTFSEECDSGMTWTTSSWYGRCCSEGSSCVLGHFCEGLKTLFDATGSTTTCGELCSTITVYSEYPDIGPTNSVGCFDNTWSIWTFYRNFPTETAVASASTISSNPVYYSDFDTSSSGISKRAIIGAVVGAVSGAAILLILGFLCLRRRSKKRAAAVATPPPPIVVSAVKEVNGHPPPLPPPPQYEIYKKQEARVSTHDESSQEKLMEIIPVDDAYQKEYASEKKMAGWVNANAWNTPGPSSSTGAGERH